MTFAPTDLLGELIALGVPAYAISECDDSIYRPPQSSWVLGDFHRWYFRALEAFGIRDYQPEAGDCDDFATLFCTLMRIAHRRTPEGAGTAIPVRQFNFLQVPDAAPGPLQRKHAIALVRTADRGWLFVEPQVLGQVERLTPAQIRSCSKCA